MKWSLFNDWANENKPDATLDDFATWAAGYQARDQECHSLQSEIERLHEILSGKCNG